MAYKPHRDNKPLTNALIERLVELAAGYPPADGARSIGEDIAATVFNAPGSAAGHSILIPTFVGIRPMLVSQSGESRRELCERLAVWLVMQYGYSGSKYDAS